ncbi:hypothetical protein GCM10007919_48530 [Rhizobium indigoferae]|nr:hypothetical protein GCM10007919_48530 [Rhizobium indigoferae]
MNQNGGDAAKAKSIDAADIASLKVEVSGNPRRGYETGDGLRTIKSSASANKRTLHARFMGLRIYWMWYGKQLTAAKCIYAILRFPMRVLA